MSDKEFGATGKLEISDFKEFFQNSKLAKIFKKIAIIISCVWIVAVILFIVFKSVIGVVICALGVVITLAAFLSYPIFAAQSTYSMFLSGKTDLEYAVLIRNKVITSSMNGNENAMPHSDVQNVINYNGKIFIYNSSFTGVIIKENDVNGGSYEELLNQLESWAKTMGDNNE